MLPAPTDDLSRIFKAPRPRPTYRPGMDSDTTTQTDLLTVLGQLADLLDDIGPAADGTPTPCPGYPLGTLRQHVVGWLTAFTDGLTDPDGRCGDAQHVAVEGSGGAQVRRQVDRLGTAFAGTLPEQVVIHDSGMPTPMALAMMLWEYQVHGWDLAVATGRPWSPDDRGLEASLEFAPGMLTDDYQGEGKTFGPRVDVPADAPALDRLLGLSGRDPGWRG